MSQHSHLYNSRRWRKRRLLQLQAEPLCRYCLRMGKTTAATVADHVEPHRGDLVKFWQGELQSLCKTCHDSVKQREESGQGAIGCDLQGWPLGESLRPQGTTRRNPTTEREDANESRRPWSVNGVKDRGT